MDTKVADDRQEGGPKLIPKLPLPNSRNLLRKLWGSSAECPFCGSHDIKRRYLSLFYLPSVLLMLIPFVFGLLYVLFSFEETEPMALLFGLALMVLGLYLFTPRAIRWTHGGLAAIVFGALAIAPWLLPILNRRTPHPGLAIAVDFPLILAFIAILWEQSLCFCRTCKNEWNTPERAVREFERERKKQKRG